MYPRFSALQLHPAGRLPAFVAYNLSGSILPPLTDPLAGESRSG